MEIGIVGGGASAVCLLDALAGEPRLPQGSLTVFEPSSHLWRGRAFQPDIDAVRVNAPPLDMSVRAADDEHFHRWLVSRELVIGSDSGYHDPWSGTRFVPRAIFGDYLEQSARSAVRVLLDHGWHVEVVRDTVDHVSESQNGVVLRTRQGATRQVGSVVLCFGAGAPADTYSLAGSAGFVAEPYPVMDRLARIDPDQDVTIIGSGLTAVDIVLALADRRHRGPIRLLSRRGALPAVRQRHVRYSLRHFTPGHFRAIAANGGSITLSQLVDVMAAELAAAGESLDAIDVELSALDEENPVARLRRQLTEVDSQSLSLRILQQAVPDAGPDVWPLLPKDEQVHILRNHYRALMSLCCPMPPSSAAALLTLFESGQLEMVRDVETVRPVPGSSGFMIRTAHSEFRSSLVINAVNARLRRFTAGAPGLVQSLVSEGLAEPHPFGGLCVERATSRLTVSSRSDRRLYALGDPAVGSLFFTFGVQSLVDRAVDIVRALHGTGPATGGEHSALMDSAALPRQSS